MQPLEILYSDASIVAINKPAGLLVHRSKVDIRATEFALQRLRDQLGQPVFPVHRLDRPVSGVLLFALSSEIAAEIASQFENRTVKKSYLAIVRGSTAASRCWDEPLIEKQDRMTDGRARKDKPAQEAITEFKRLETWTVPYSAGKYPHSRYSLVEARPRTGRKHQLRRHFNHMAHPIVGDTTYGDRRHNHLFREQFGVRRLLLVAKRLEVDHPVSGQRIVIEASVGEEFDAALKVLEKHNVLAAENSK